MPTVKAQMAVVHEACLPMLTVWPFVTDVDRTSDARFALPANLPADAYPMLNEIEKPQVWRKTRQAHALQE